MDSIGGRRPGSDPAPGGQKAPPQKEENAAIFYERLRNDMRWLADQQVKENRKAHTSLLDIRSDLQGGV